jgi:hypothetical protein
MRQHDGGGETGSSAFRPPCSAVAPRIQSGRDGADCLRTGALGLPNEGRDRTGEGVGAGFVTDVRNRVRLHQPLARPMHQLGVGRKGHGLGLHGRIDNRIGEIGGLGRAGPCGD